MATIQQKETTVVSIFEIGISQNAKCDNLVRYQVTYNIAIYRLHFVLYTNGKQICWLLLNQEYTDL